MPHPVYKMFSIDKIGMISALKIGLDEGSKLGTNSPVYVNCKENI